jgi:uncharacterized GH25 family protein
MKTLSLLLTTATLAAGPALAHDFWIEPLDFEVQAGGAVAVRLRVGELFTGDVIMPEPDSIAQFFATDSSGRRPLRPVSSAQPLAVLAARQSGLLAIGYESRPATVTLSAEPFERYLRDEGLDHVIVQRDASGTRLEPGRELFARSVKSLVRIEGEAPEPASLAPLGLPLELVPESDPYQLGTGSKLDLQLLYQGQPEPDILVVAMAQDDPLSSQRARTDATGRVTFSLDRPGPWLVKAVRMDAAPADSGADWMSWWASLTFSIRGG